MDASDSRLATGRRSQDSAMLTAAWWSIMVTRTGLPVSMHSTYGVPGGYSSTSPVGNAASQPGEPSSVATASRRSSWEPSGGLTGNSSPAATLSSTSRPAAVQKWGTRILIRPRATWSRSSVAPICRKVSSSSECRIRAGSTNRSCWVGGIFSTARAARPGVSPSIGCTLATVSTRRPSRVPIGSTAVASRPARTASSKMVRAGRPSRGSQSGR